jgi:hypothetical protein
MRLITALLLLGLQGCGPTAHVPLSEVTDQASPAVFRTVGFHLSEAFWQAAPDCVVILPSGPAAAASFEGEARAVERAAARQAFERFDRVIGPDNRDRLERRLGLDLSNTGDRRRFARLTRCGHGIAVAPEGGMAWAMVWAEVQITVELAMSALEDDKILWQARHTARRGDGGLPVSPVSILMAAGAAAAFAQDGDVMPSLIDDALRRTFLTLPDVRVGPPELSARPTPRLSAQPRNGIAQGW